MQVIPRHISCAAEVAPHTAQNLAVNGAASAITPPAGRAAVLSMTLCVMVGNMLIGRLLAARLGRVLALIPAAMAAIALALVVLGGHVWPVAALLIAWGLVSTPTRAPLP